jgi:hypothetical protein
VTCTASLKGGEMAQITRSIKINAPLPKVFDYVTKSGNWTKYVTGLVDVRNVSSDIPEAGTTFEWTYRMLGVNNDGMGRIGDLDGGFIPDKGDIYLSGRRKLNGTYF